MLRRLFGLSVALCVLVSAGGALADDPPTFADRPDRDFAENDRALAVLLNPLDAAVGVYGAETDFALGRHLAVGVEGAVYNIGGPPGTALGSGLLVYPGAVFHGLYLEPRVVYARPMSERITTFGSASDTFGAGGTAGWQWTWDYGFTLRLGAGGMYFAGGSGPGSMTSGGMKLAMDGSVGWAF